MSWWTNFRDGFTQSSGVSTTTASSLGVRAGGSAKRNLSRRPAAPTPALIDPVQPVVQPVGFAGLPASIGGVPTRTVLIGVGLALAYKFFR